MADLELIKKQHYDKHIFQVYVFEADWTVRADLERLRRFCIETFDSIDKLVLCAGVLSTLLFENLCDLQEFDSIVENIFKINVIAPIIATQVFLPDLMKQKGQIVVISSAAGVMAAPTRSLYTATKHSVTGFFRALRIELAPKDVSVCIVMPGSVDTNLRNSALDAKYSSQPKKSNGISVEECVGFIIEGIENRECEIFIPKSYRFGASLVNIVPFLIDYLAKKKYEL
jgi:short-subunit dehydrogenase